jgi:hypothetical protein
MKIPAPKIGALQIRPKRESNDSLENGYNNFDYISEIYGDHILK